MKQKRSVFIKPQDFEKQFQISWLEIKPRKIGFVLNPFFIVHEQLINIS